MYRGAVHHRVAPLLPVAAVLLLWAGWAHVHADAADNAVTVALIGSGIFATKAYAPLLQRLSKGTNAGVRTVAVWSRKADNAQKVAGRVHFRTRI